MTRTYKESQKLSKLMLVADEVVLAKLSNRIEVVTLRAKGFMRYVSNCITSSLSDNDF
jgi:hypothetical protein